MQITGVGSRRVIQLGACVAIVFGLIGKVGGLFASMPRETPFLRGLCTVIISYGKYDAGKS